MTPTARSTAHLREQGFLVERVEHYNAFTKRSHDLLGFADLLAIRPGELLLVQVTSTSNAGARLKKCLASPGLRAWLEGGGRAELHDWSKRGPAGKRKLWTIRVRELTLADLEALPIVGGD